MGKISWENGPRAPTPSGPPGQLPSGLVLSGQSCKAFPARRKRGPSVPPHPPRQSLHSRNNRSRQGFLRPPPSSCQASPSPKAGQGHFPLVSLLLQWDSSFSNSLARGCRRWSLASLSASTLAILLAPFSRNRPLRGHSIITSEGFPDPGFLGSLPWQQRPESDRGAALSLTQTVDGSSPAGRMCQAPAPRQSTGSSLN